MKLLIAVFLLVLICLSKEDVGCCLNGACFVRNREYCLEKGGVPLERRNCVNSTCSGSLDYRNIRETIKLENIPYACCLKSCQMLLQSECEAKSGIFNKYKTCATFECPA